MKMHLFANRVHRMYFSSGSVVIEFCVIPPDDNGEVSPTTTIGPDDVPFAITLPLAGFMRSVGEMRKFTEEMQKKGLLKKPEGDDRNAERLRRQTELQDLTSDGPGEPLV